MTCHRGIRVKFSTRMETFLKFFSSSHSPDVIHMQALAFNFIFEMGNCQKALKNGTSKIDCIVKII